MSNLVFPARYRLMHLEDDLKFRRFEDRDQSLHVVQPIIPNARNDSMLCWQCVTS